MPRSLKGRLAGFSRRAFDAAAPALAALPSLRPAVAHRWEALGRLTSASRLLADRPDDPYAVRLRELTAALAAGGLPLPEKVDTGVRCGKGGVVMALHASEPWLRNGYTARTRLLLRQVAEAGVSCEAVTRPNFPWDLAAHRAAPEAVADEAGGVVYHRLRSDPTLWEGPLGAYVEAFAEGLAGRARAAGAAVVHGASNHVVGLAACLAAERIGGRSVYEIRGLWHLSTATRRAGWDATETFALHEALERQAARRADRVVVLSRALAAHVEGWGVPADHIVLVPNGMDDSAFRPVPRDPAVRAAWGVPEGAFVVGTVGTLTPYEGIDILLEAVARLRGEGIDARAVVIGLGEDEARLKALARPLGAAAVFPGRIPPDQVPAALRAMDCCPFPRIASPVTRLVPPLKVPEAMACGVPVVVADLPALAEDVEDGRTGLIFGHGAKALAAALRRLHDDPGAAAALARQGAAWAAENRSWPAVVAPLLDAWRELGVSAPADA